MTPDTLSAANSNRLNRQLIAGIVSALPETVPNTPEALSDFSKQLNDLTIFTADQVTTLEGVCQDAFTAIKDFLTDTITELDTAFVAL